MLFMSIMSSSQNYQPADYPGPLQDNVPTDRAGQFQTDYPQVSRQVANGIDRAARDLQQNPQRSASWTDGNWSGDSNLADSNWSGVINPNRWDNSDRRGDQWDRSDRRGDKWDRSDRRGDQWDRRDNRDNRWDRRGDQWDRRGNIGSIDSTFYDREGRRCRLVCEAPRPRPQPNLNRIAQSLIGLNLEQAQRIYPFVRVVVRDGQPLAVTQDYRSNRINVETRYGRIVRIDGFY